MKKAVLLSVLVVAVGVSVVLLNNRRSAPAPLPTYNESLVYVLEQIRHTKMHDGSSEIGGFAAGLGGKPHRFFLLVQYVNRVAMPPDMELMLQDQNPAVRIAGVLACMGERGKGLGMNPKLVDALLTDSQRVTILNDCIPRGMTVGEIVAGLRKEPGFLGLSK